MNSNIFPGGQGPFAKALPGFAAIRELALPVTPAKSGAACFYSIKQTEEAGKTSLQVFTDEKLVAPPFIKRPLKDAAILLFHAPAHDSFIFNPGATRAQPAPLTASRRDVSLLAGFAAAAAGGAQDPARLAAGEFALGRLHSAHYLFTLAAAANPSSGARFALASVLIELGLLQEAYDGLKTSRDPEALLNLAVIYRKTGSPDRAREYLAAIGQGTPLEDRKAAETAWLDLEAGKEEQAKAAFKRLSASAFDKAEALSGLGEVLSRAAFKTQDKGLISEAENVLRSALVSPSSASGRVFLQLGGLYFRAGDNAAAEGAYRKAAALAPSLQALANLALTLLKTGKLAEAAAVTLQLALTDAPSAGRLAAGFPPERLQELFPEAPKPEPVAPERFPTPVPSAPPRMQPPLPARSANEASLAPAQPQTPPPIISARRQAEPAPARAEEARQEVKLETFKEAMAAQQLPSEEESRRDDFISRAFRLASLLEDELGRKVYFNLDGLGEVEKKLRLAFIKNKENPQANLEIVKDCSAFLCYFLQERHKGRLIKMIDYDPWGWPMVFETAGARTVTYPVQRVWRLLWEPALPDPGWLTKYSTWLTGRLKEPAAAGTGAAAAKAKIMSHPERITDAQTEHKRLLILISSLPETANIELGRTGLFKLETALKNNFRPGIPPATDGWKLLRCYGHILAEILVKDFKASWYNTDGNDGGWSMRLPWKTLVFPMGKVYKTAADRGSLNDYYDVLLGDKLRNAGPSAG